MDKKKIISENNVFEMNSNVLRFLKPEQKTYLENTLFSVSFNQGENIFKQGAPMSHIIIIVKGMAKVYLEDGNHRNIIMRIIKSGELIGGPGFYNDNKHHFSVTTLEDTTAYFIEIEDYKKLILENSEFALRMINHLNEAHINSYKKFKITLHKQMNGRLADTLLYLSNNIYNSNIFDTKLSRQDLADMSSMTKESAIRILKDFKSSGIISCTNNHFEILNKTALQNILENG